MAKATSTARPTKVVASLRTEVAKVAKMAGVSVASLALALSANAATIKMGADNGERLLGGALALIGSETDCDQQLWGLEAVPSVGWLAHWLQPCSLLWMAGCDWE